MRQLSTAAHPSPSHEASAPGFGSPLPPCAGGQPITLDLATVMEAYRAAATRVLSALSPRSARPLELELTKALELELRTRLGPIPGLSAALAAGREAARG